MKETKPYRIKDLTGHRFGRLIVKGQIQSDQHHTQWECLCDCGRTVTLDRQNLRSAKSCGCYRRERRRTELITHGLSRTKSGSHTRLYDIWRGMKKRCLNPKIESYPRYGGRGITICSEWGDYTHFYAWAMENGYRSNLTIERKDNNGNYEPDNCTWIPLADQAKNRRSTVRRNP